MQIFLNPDEMKALTKQDPATARDEGWHSLLVQLLSNTNKSTGELTLTDEDLEHIQRYAFDSGNSAWQNRLTAIFGRHLGSRLGRQ